LEKPLVLLAEDNEATCTLIRAILRSDFEVDVVHDGGDAIEKLKACAYAVVLLDLHMPVSDGFAVLDFLRQERPEMLSRVLIVTAALAVADMERVRRYSVAGVIAKPFEVDVLYAAVRACAGSSGPEFIRGPLFASGVLLLLAEVLRRV
jgi:CheY-like chemotaxis protein